jgi:carbon monoxide dehydrogenase subunit G
MSLVQQTIEVTAPLHTVYEQLAAFENYPRFMTGVRAVTPIGNDQTHWVMDVDGALREFDAQITERSLDERVAWSAVDGPQMAETITLRPLGETRTQVVAQLEADAAFLLPSDRHAQASLTKRLREDLTTFKGLVESGVLGNRPKPVGGPADKAKSVRTSPKRPAPGGVSTKRLSSPASVAARIRDHRLRSQVPTGTDVDITSAPGITSSHDLDDVLAPGRRIAKSGPISGGAAGTAPMGGRTTRGGRVTPRDIWGDGMINEEDRGSAHDM